MSDETLAAVKKLIEDRMKQAGIEIPDALIQAYLQLKILERLESIDTTLAAIGDDIWNDHHNK